MSEYNTTRCGCVWPRLVCLNVQRRLLRRHNLVTTNSIQNGISQCIVGLVVDLGSAFYRAPANARYF